MSSYLFRRALALASYGLVSWLAACGPTQERAPASDEEVPLAVAQSELSSDCTGIAPTLGTPVTHTLLLGSNSGCWRATSDGMGNIALGTLEWFGEYGYWSPTPRTGGPPTGPSMYGIGMYELFPNWGSFQGRSITPRGEEIWLKTWTHNGNPLANVRIDHGSADTNRREHLSRDRGGGVLMVYGGQSNLGNHWFVLTAQRFFPDGSARSAPRIVHSSGPSVPAWMLGGVGFYRESLVLFDGAAAGMGGEHVAGIWVDPVGNLLTPVFDAGRISGIYGSSLALAPLYDGSLVLQRNGQWVLRIPRRATSSTPAPAWLASRPNTQLEWIRGGRGYGLTPFGFQSVSVCRQQISLHAQDGTFCGNATFSVDSAPCITQQIDIGRDGTVIQVSPRNTCSDGGCTCTRRWWPQVLY